jgi:N-acetyl-gamma-glutamyl-phosphate reductase
MEQNLTKAAGVRASVSFTPVLVPMSRGILAVNTVRVADKFDFETLKLVYQDAYSDEPFIQLLSDQLPTTAAVLGSNNVQISLAFDQHTGRVVVVSAIDNLVKGTAGAAIQSMNLALGLAETSGLMFGAVAP